MKAVKRVRFLAVLYALAAIGPLACTARLNEQDVATRLSAELKLPAAAIRVRSISADPLPVATVDYGGATAAVRFRRQQGTWVIDAVAKDGGWERADTAMPVLGHQLVEKARERWTSDVMPRYASTIKLLVGWTELLGTSCGDGLPANEVALLNLHAAWHRTLFPNRGVEFHNSGLFLRDAWQRVMRTELSPSRIAVTSAGADGKFGSGDDMRLLFTRTSRENAIPECQPHYAIPSFVAAALGRPDAPSDWNCADMLAAFKQAGMLDIVEEPAR